MRGPGWQRIRRNHAGLVNLKPDASIHSAPAELHRHQLTHSFPPLLDCPSAFIPFRFFFIVSPCDLFPAVCIFVWAYLYLRFIYYRVDCFPLRVSRLSTSCPGPLYGYALIYFAPTLIAQQASRSHAGAIYYFSLIISVIAIVEHTSALCLSHLTFCQLFSVSFLLFSLNLSLYQPFAFALSDGPYVEKSFNSQLGD